MKKKMFMLAMTAMMTAAMSMNVFAAETAQSGNWQKDYTGWWWQNEDGSYPTGNWVWIDGNRDGKAECYYFDASGYMRGDTTTPDGYQLNTDGAWVVDGVVQTKDVEVPPTPNQADQTQKDTQQPAATVEDHGGYNDCGVSNTAIEMLENSREENAKFGEIKIDDSVTGQVSVYYSNGFLVTYPTTGSSYKRVNAVDTNHNYNFKQLFKLYDESITSADEAVQYLIRNGYHKGVGEHTCYADGTTVWVNIDKHAVMWNFFVASYHPVPSVHLR